MAEIKTFLDEEGLNAYHTESIKKMNDEISDHNSSPTAHEDIRDYISELNDSTLTLERMAHEHSNETILDNTTASFTATLKDKLDSIEGGANNYTLPNATTSVKGGVIIGDNIQISNGKISVLNASTSQTGVVALIDSTQSTSTTSAATPNSVKKAYDLANTAKTAASGAQTTADSKSDIGHKHTVSEITDLTVSAKELNYMKNVTSNVQEQLDGKAPSSHGTHVAYSTVLPEMDGNASVGTASAVARSDHKHPTDTTRASQSDFNSLKTTVSNKANTSDLTAHIIDENNPHNVTLPILGVTATATELNYVDGVTSNIQTQLNGKAASSHGNHVPATQTANNATFLRNDNTWQKVTPANIGAATSSHGTHVTYSTDAPKANGTASAGSASTVSTSDHVHPLQTSVTGSSGSCTGNAATATTATKLGTTTKGSGTKPIYLSSGTATECSTYAGGTAVTLNGVNKGGSTASLFAPTSAGTSGQLLKSSGSGAPVWITTLPIANGGTGATSASSALVNLGGLPLTGGTLTGSLNVQSAISSTTNMTAPDVYATEEVNTPLLVIGSAKITYDTTKEALKISFA